MNATDKAQAERLRLQAQIYRRLAAGTLPWEVAEQLEEWAAACERQAGQLSQSPSIAVGARRVKVA